MIGLPVNQLPQDHKNKKVGKEKMHIAIGFERVNLKRQRKVSSIRLTVIFATYEWLSYQITTCTIICC